MDTPALPRPLCMRILRHLGFPVTPPVSLYALRMLMTRYTQCVPWESASRIARRAKHELAADCALLGADFWHSHFKIGSGGTCYESNYAFFGLLRWLGYEGYLTINDMGESIGCHSAIVLRLDGRKWLVDVGIPLHAPLPIPESGASETDSRFFRYGMRAEGQDRYEITRHPHPSPLIFTLVDEPVADADYRRIAIKDYSPDTGLFLDKVVINKVATGQMWRFNSEERPWHLQQFAAGERINHALDDDAVEALAWKFGMSAQVIAAGLEAVASQESAHSA